jgi:hypothetical protein
LPEKYQTPSLKLKRYLVEKDFKDQLSALYEKICENQKQ